MSKDKTVYIIGAGFSKSANIPLQSELLDEIFKVRKMIYLMNMMNIKIYLINIEMPLKNFFRIRCLLKKKILLK